MTTADSQIDDISVQDELKTSFLSYAMSVIVSRALPDVRDGLKPVHRRILFGMAQMNLRPDRAHVKCSRVVGDVMGKLHPHGDSAIYESMVRLAVPWSLRLPLIDGHGNFGTQTDGPAAQRYTEARMSKAAVSMTSGLDEDTVDFQANYDGKLQEPRVLPAAFPNLLVNGAEGIAVGMATRIPPHNLGEVVAAAKHVLRHPDATVEDVMVHIPGPDLPTGAIVLNQAGIEQAYRTGRGMFVMRARTHFEDITARKKGIVVTELPYQVGPEHVIAKVKEQRDAKRLAGVANVVDLSDRKVGLRLVIECKAGFDPQAVLDELLRLTPMQTNYHVHNLALVSGEPRTLTLLELVTHYVDHRVAVTTRRTQFRRRKVLERTHLLEGFLTALAKITEVVAVLMAAKDTATARVDLMERFVLSEVQASAILEMPLRRLTGLEVEHIRGELTELRAKLATLEHLLSDPNAMHDLVASELDEIVALHGTPRRATLSDATPTIAKVEAAVAQVPNEACTVTVSTTGLISRWSAPFCATHTKDDALTASLTTNTHEQVGALTSHGRLVSLAVADLPAGQGKERGAPLATFLQLLDDEQLVALVPLGQGSNPIAMATRAGLVKILNVADLPRKSDHTVIGLKEGDQVVGAGTVPPAGADLVFITSDGQLLRTASAGVRPQGRTGAGVAGIKVADGAHVVEFATTPSDAPHISVVTVATGACWTSAKTSPLSHFPAKGRGTSGVRAHRMLRGEDRLALAAVGETLTGVSANGALVPLPDGLGKRDGAGIRTSAPLVALATRR